MIPIANADPGVLLIAFAVVIGLIVLGVLYEIADALGWR